MRQAMKSGAAAVLLARAALLPDPAIAQDDSTPSTGVFKTAQEIYTLCVSDKASDIEACDWYIMAAHDMIKFYGDTGTGGAKICIPMGTEELAIRNVMLNYWRAHADEHQFSAVSTIYLALEDAYGC